MPMNSQQTMAPGVESWSVAGASIEGCCRGLLLLARGGGGQVTWLSPETGRFLGLPATAKPPLNLEALPEALRSLLEAALASGQDISKQKLELNVGPLAPRTLEVCVARPGFGEHAGGLVVTLTDLTQAQLLQKRMQQLDRLGGLGTLAAVTAHEIKNALVTGKTFVELLLEKHPEEELGEIARKELGRIDSLLARMLNYAGKQPGEREVVRLHDVLDYSLQLVQSRTRAQNISVTRELLASRDELRGEASDLEQVFVNLFLNALDAMGTNGSLTVRSESVSADAIGAPGLLVTVRDTGHGICPADQERLFEPFFSTKPDGTGLGLAITRRILAAHGGGIRVASSSNNGTTFEVRLPALPVTG